MKRSVNMAGLQDHQMVQQYYIYIYIYIYICIYNVYIYIYICKY